MRPYRRIVMTTLKMPLSCLLYALTVLAILTTSCSQQGLVTERYTEDVYRVPKLLPDEPHTKNPTFILYGDIRPGYRLQEKFLHKDNWYTKKMLLFPLYELYVFGNGIAGLYEYLRNDSGFGYGEREMVRQAVYNEAVWSKADFIVNTGDFVIDGRYPEHWLRFVTEHKTEHRLLQSIPYLPVIGSHEFTNDSTYGMQNYQAVFAYPGFYTVEYKDTELFFLNSNIIIDNKQLIADDTQDELFGEWFVSENGTNPSWLEKKLAASKKRFKIVVLHNPLVSFSKHHHDWLSDNNGRNLREKRKRLIGLLQHYGVQIVFSGHEHLYEHSVLRYEKSTGMSAGEIHFIISGGGGVPLRDTSDTDTCKKYLEHFRNEGFEVELVTYEKKYHYCRVSIDNEQISIDVYEVTENQDNPLNELDKIVIP
ncbi:metallophosphoesterase family protein [Candidatus Latescibacterota bacterium]